MSKWIDYDAIDYKHYQLHDKSEEFLNGVIYMAQCIEGAPSIDLVRCAECKKVREDGGHANCNGYLYCRKWKTLVDEDCFCSWGEREGE